MLRGYPPKSTEICIKTFLKSTNKTLKFLSLFHHNLVELISSDIWKIRNDLYSSWMTLQPCTYKAYCTQLPSLRPSSTPIFASPSLFDYKLRRIIPTTDKQIWAAELTKTAIMDHITKSSQHLWNYNKRIVKCAAKSTKIITQSNM